METEAPKAAVVETNRDSGVYVLLINQGDPKYWSYQTVESKKDLTALLEKIGAANLDKVKVFKGAKEVEIKTKLTFTF